MENESKLTYWSYLSLGSILDAQHPLSEEHDEYLFIVIHQTKELWFFQILKELRKAGEFLEAGEIDKTSRPLDRIVKIFEVMTASWNILATLSKAEFLRFRDNFMDAEASGVQSLQFRQIEFLLGIKEASETGLKRQTDPELREKLQADLDRPSLWDMTNRALANAGYAISDRVLSRACGGAYVPDEMVEQVWGSIYGDIDNHRSFYRLGQNLDRIARALDAWRSKHIKTVSHFIGSGPGSGGTEGVPYLRETLALRAFPELWKVTQAKP